MYEREDYLDKMIGRPVLMLERRGKRRFVAMRHCLMYVEKYVSCINIGR